MKKAYIKLSKEDEPDRKLAARLTKFHRGESTAQHLVWEINTECKNRNLPLIFGGQPEIASGAHRTERHRFPSGAVEVHLLHHDVLEFEGDHIDVVRSVLNRLGKSNWLFTDTASDKEETKQVLFDQNIETSQGIECLYGIEQYDDGRVWVYYGDGRGNSCASVEEALKTLIVDAMGEIESLDRQKTLFSQMLATLTRMNREIQLEEEVNLVIKAHEWSKARCWELVGLGWDTYEAIRKCHEECDEKIKDGTL